MKTITITVTTNLGPELDALILKAVADLAAEYDNGPQMVCEATVNVGPNEVARVKGQHVRDNRRLQELAIEAANRKDHRLLHEMTHQFWNRHHRHNRVVKVPA